MSTRLCSLDNSFSFITLSLVLVLSVVHFVVDTLSISKVVMIKITSNESKLRI